MATTFRDVLLECELYPFSQEHFDLMKECSEIELMNAYLARYEFVQEAKEEEADLGNLVTESYFGESVDENELQVIQESVISKMKNVAKKIWKGICKIFKALGRFIGVCGTKVEQQQTAIEAIFRQPVPSGKSTTNTDTYHFYWTDEAVKKLEPVVNKYTGDQGVISFPKQSGGMNIKYEYDNNGLKSKVKALDDAFKAALAFNGTTVIIRPKIKAATFDQAVDIANKLKDPKSLSASGNIEEFADAFQNVLGQMKNGGKKGQYDYFKVKIDAGYLKETSKALSDAATAMEQATDQIGLVSQKEGGANKGNEATREKRGRAAAAFYSDDPGNVGGIGAGAASKLHSNYADVNAFISNTLKVFNAYMGFRRDVIKLYGEGTKKKPGIGELRTDGSVKTKDLAGKDHNTPGGEGIDATEIEAGSGAKDAKAAKAEKGKK